MKTYTLEELRLAQAKGCRIEYLTVGQAGWVTVESPVYDGGIGCYRIHPDDEWKATPSTPAPDYGEPWEPSCEMIFDRDGDYVAEFQPPFHDNSTITARAVACVNAMAGVPDPAAFVAEAKEMQKKIIRLEWELAIHREDIPAAQKIEREGGLK